MVSRANMRAIYVGASTGAVAALMTIALSMAFTRTYDFVSDKFSSFTGFGGGKVRPRGRPGLIEDDDAD